jgi:predicted nucleotidyltransferase
MTVTGILKEKREEILHITSSYGAHNVRIFGSMARGTMRAGSDLDILVTLDADRSLLDVIAIKQDLEDLLNCKVDVVTEAAISPYMREQVLKEAVSL